MHFYKAIVIDLETTGKDASIDRIWQIAYLIAILENGQLQIKKIKEKILLYPNERIHDDKEIIRDLTDVHALYVGHNISFEQKFLLPQNIFFQKVYCTMKETTDLCKIPHKNGFNFKWPKLEEAAKILPKDKYKIPNVILSEFSNFNYHDAIYDVITTLKIFAYLININTLNFENCEIKLDNLVKKQKAVELLSFTNVKK